MSYLYVLYALYGLEKTLCPPYMSYMPYMVKKNFMSSFVPLWFKKTLFVLHIFTKLKKYNMFKLSYIARSLSVLFLLCSTTGIFAQEGINFYHGAWKEAIEMAKKENKIIFVDAFAKWCGPCKRMASTVFTDAKVGEFFNSNFVNMKLDMEEEEGFEFRDLFPVSAFPTLFFIDPAKGEVVQKQVGALDADGFLKLARNVLGKVDNSAEFAKLYEQGNREPELILNYIMALNRGGKSSLKIANDYLIGQQDLTTTPNLKIISEAATEADSRIFDLLIKYKNEISTLMGAEQWSKKVENACQKTANKALEFKDAALHNEAKTKMKQYCPQKADAFASNADLKFYVAAGDASGFVKAAENFLKNNGKNDASKLNQFSEQVLKTYPDNKTALVQAEKWSEKAATNGGLFNYFLTYAQVLQQLGKKTEALAAAEKAKNIAKEGNPGAVQAIDRLIELLKG